MAKLSEYVKTIIIVVLRLILMLLKKSGKTPIHRNKDGLHKRTSRNCVFSAEESETTDNSLSSMTSTSKLSSGIGSSICLTDSHSTSTQVEDVFESPDVCPLEDEIERLRIENQALREKLSQKLVEPRRNLVYRRGRTSLSQAMCQMSSTTRPTTSEDDDIHDVVQEKLKLKLELEKEENSRLQNYINDVMYMVLETRPSLLEK